MQHTLTRQILAISLEDNSMKKNGFTIIELMVGLAVSMLCMVAMLLLFKQISHTSITAKQSADYDAQLQTGLLVIHKMVQNAGFGSGKSTDIMTGQFEGQPALFWRQISELNANPKVYECHGVSEIINNDGKFTTHQLVRLSRNCGDQDPLDEGKWVADQVIATLSDQYSAALFNYSIQSANCSPYGITTQAQALKQVIVTAQLQSPQGSTQKLTNSVCLHNIR